MTLKRHIPRQKWIWISCHLMLGVREVVLTASIRKTFIYEGYVFGSVMQSIVKYLYITKGYLWITVEQHEYTFLIVL